MQLTTLNNYKRGKYRLLYGIILIRRKDGWKRLTPSSLRTLIILKAHLLGHYLTKELTSIVQQTDHWPGLNKDCQEFLSTCLSYLFVRTPHEEKQKLGVAVQTKSNEIWMIYVVSGLPSRRGQNTIFLQELRLRRTCPEVRVELPKLLQGHFLYWLGSSSGSNPSHLQQCGTLGRWMLPRTMMFGKKNPLELGLCWHWRNKMGQNESHCEDLTRVGIHKRTS